MNWPQTEKENFKQLPRWKRKNAFRIVVYKILLWSSTPPTLLGSPPFHALWPQNKLVLFYELPLFLLAPVGVWEWHQLFYAHEASLDGMIAAWASPYRCTLLTKKCLGEMTAIWAMPLIQQSWPSARINA